MSWTDPWSTLKAAGARATGLQYSHWIPDRILKKTGSKFLRDTFGRSVFNGNYVTPIRHYLHDPYSYFRGWEELGPKWNPILQQLDRIPNVFKGSAIGGAYGGASQAVNSGSKCGCP